ncbi:MAG: pyridoxamine 5'-phosphate oxidase [Actinobacteria bacterium]|nr:pyridoxamine 5'-phosphate oxidase [Actinomycetota bacterium]
MLAADPMTQFGRWFADAQAAGLPEPNAMVLSTVSAQGWPRSRSVLLKAHGPGGFTFYTNRTSGKAADLAACPRASLLFPWYGLRRQVIIQGEVTALTQQESEPYFHSRPRGSQLGAWASRQSTVIPARTVLEERYARLAERWPEPAPVPMPDFWGGYQVHPEIAEFWQGRANRMHDRLRYRRLGDGGGWLVERLSP